MSMGYGGYAKMIDSDDEYVVYSYSCFNANNDDYKEYMHKIDGEILIKKSAFVEPEIREKKKKMPSGKKKVVIKRIRQEYSLEEKIAEESIIVNNASGTWKTNAVGVDYIACRLIKKIIDDYQETGEIPEVMGFFS